MIGQNTKKWNIGIVLLVAVFAITFVMPALGTDVAQAATFKGVVVIDPGHGMSDPGASAYASGDNERKMNARVAYKTAKALQNEGFTVYLTHRVNDVVPGATDVPVLIPYDKSKYGFIDELGKYSNSVNPDLHISIHQNASTSHTAVGMETWWSSGQNTSSAVREQSKTAATMIFNRIADTGLFKKRSVKDFQVLYNGLNSGPIKYCSAPAMLVECCFIDSKNDYNIISKDANQQKVAAAIAKGASDFVQKYGTKHSSSVTKTPPKVDKVLVMGAQSPTTKGAFNVSAKNVSAEAGIKKVVFRVVPPSGASKSLNGFNEGSGTWTLPFTVSKFGNKTGVYQFMAYVYDNNGTYTKTTNRKISIGNETTAPTLGKTSVVDPNLDTGFEILHKGAKDDSGIESVKFQIWHSSKTNVKDTFAATANSDGTWDALADLSKFKNQTGTYKVKTVVYDTWKNYSTVTGSFSVKTTSNSGGSTDKKFVLSTTNPTAATRFTVRIDGVTDASGVEFKVRNLDKSLESLPEKWVKGTAKGSGSYQMTLDISQYKGYYGRYQIAAYSVDSKGLKKLLSSEVVDVRSSLGKTPIMGSPQATVDQMVNFYVSSNRMYPSYYTQSPRSTSLRDFAQMYYDVAVMEGVRPEIAWVQMCLETGYLQFGGDVKKEQFNFAGLGATGGGVRGFDFASKYGNNKEGIRHGVIGHVQHLKCYASKEGVHYKVGGQPVDPRWSAAVSAGYRGKAPYLEDLENNWAATVGYSKNLINLLARLMEMPATAMSELEQQAMIEMEPQLVEELEGVKEMPVPSPETTNPIDDEQGMPEEPIQIIVPEEPDDNGMPDGNQPEQGEPIPYIPVETMTATGAVQ